METFVKPDSKLFSTDSQPDSVDSDQDYQLQTLFNDMVCAVKNGDLQELQSQELGELAKMRDEQGSTLLHHAAQARKTDALSLLLEQGCFNLDFQDNMGKTTLHIAVQLR